VNKICLLITGVLIASPVYALQKIAVEDGQTVPINISSNEPNRLAIKDGRISKAWGAEAHLTVLPHSDSGELFFTPLANADEKFSFFIKDSNGGTYTIAVTQKLIPSETIILETTVVDKKAISESQKERKDMPYIVRIKQLIGSMASTSDDHPYEVVRNLDQPVPLWHEVSMMLTSQYSAKGLKGDIYELVNITEDQMVLSESEFLNFGHRVLAVAIDHMTLLPKQSTNVYIVREEY